MNALATLLVFIGMVMCFSDSLITNGIGVLLIGSMVIAGMFNGELE